MKHKNKSKKNWIHLWLSILSLGIVSSALIGVSATSNASFKQTSTKNTQVKQDNEAIKASSDVASDGVIKPVVFNTPVYDVSSTELHSTWTTTLSSVPYAINVTHTGDRYATYEGTQSNMLSFQIDRSTLAFGFEISNNDDMKEYVQEYMTNHNVQRVPFKDLYNYTIGNSGNSGLVSKLSLAMKNGSHIATANVKTWTHFSDSKLEDSPLNDPSWPQVHPGYDSYESSESESIKLFGQVHDVDDKGILPGQSQVTWESDDGKFAIRYDANQSIMDNIYISYYNVALKSFAISFGSAMKFSISLMKDNQWYNNLFTGSDFQDSQNVTTIYDDGVNEGVGSGLDYTPVAASYSICDIEQAQNIIFPAIPRGGKVMFKQDDFIIYDINGKVLNNLDPSDWCTLWRTNLTIKQTKATINAHEHYQKTGLYNSDDTHTITNPWQLGTPNASIISGTYENKNPDKSDDMSKNCSYYEAFIPFWMNYWTQSGRGLDPVEGTYSYKDEIWVDSVDFTFSIIDTKTNVALFDFNVSSLESLSLDIADVITNTTLGTYNNENNNLIPGANWIIQQINAQNNTSFGNDDLSIKNIKYANNLGTADVYGHGNNCGGYVSVNFTTAIIDDVDITKIITNTTLGTYINFGIDISYPDVNWIIQQINAQNNTGFGNDDLSIGNFLQLFASTEYAINVYGNGKCKGDVIVRLNIAKLWD